MWTGGIKVGASAIIHVIICYMPMPQRKVGPDEKKPPRVEVQLRDYQWNKKVEIVFNQNDECFQFDIIKLRIGGNEAYVSRDELAMAIINGYKKATPEELQDENV